MESGQVHPFFTGILATFAHNYERKIVTMDEDQQLARDRAEGTLEARKIQDEDAKAEFRFESAREDYRDEMREKARLDKAREEGDEPFEGEGDAE
jgi:hypothetical protein